MIITDKRCWTEIDLSQIIENYRIYKNHLPEKTKVMAVVKADAYGHGDAEIAEVLQKEGVADFAVATLDEAIKLRTNGIKGQIFVLGYTPISQAQNLIEYNITQAIVDENHAKILSIFGFRLKAVFALDTGMNRIGLDADFPDYCEQVIRKYSDILCVQGIFTHLCTADSMDKKAVEFTNNQIKKFEEVAKRIQDLKLPYIHCLNSAGGLWNKCDKSVFARLGIILYGLKPSYSNTLPEGISPALSWYSVVSMVKNFHSGETVGYGRTFKAAKEMKIATICTGYADGYNRLLSNKYYVLINGRKAPIVGRICMDQMMVDISEIENVEMGTRVTLIGQDGDEIITADDMANAIGTIGYEIVCNISKRVQRKFMYKLLESS
ncbi:MAG: alanine racemase [Spirochaetaceae bacterium]|nr:alanine racemase [Spirochaetaceae bacterium]